ncbi:MAG TPA: hypothetical protein VNW94_26850, partial [Streptosporangiaceae bacterium]|nr:hypothetical protein [Streptosporangiaceae bacterium]
MAGDEALEFGRRDLHPAADDHVLGPVDVTQVLQVVAGDLEDVPGPQVAVLVERVGHAAGRQVAGEHAWSLDAQLAGDARLGDLRARGRIHDPRQRRARDGERPAPGAVTREVLRAHRRVGDVLGRAEQRDALVG